MHPESSQRTMREHDTRDGTPSRVLRAFTYPRALSALNNSMTNATESLTSVCTVPTPRPRHRLDARARSCSPSLPAFFRRVRRERLRTHDGGRAVAESLTWGRCVREEREQPFSHGPRKHHNALARRCGGLGWARHIVHPQRARQRRDFRQRTCLCQ